MDILFFVVWIAGSIGTGEYAKRLRKSPVVWFLVAVSFSPFVAFISLYQGKKKGGGFS